MATLQTMMDFVRLQADTDENDAPNSLLSYYAAMSYQDIQSRVFPWPDKKTAYTFQTVPGQSTYPYALIPIPDLQFVISVATPDRVLQYVSAEEMLSLSVGHRAGYPYQVYTADSTGLTLWPPPDSAVTVSVSGYRRFVAWPGQIGSTEEPDLPRQFDTAIPWFMLSKFYSSQEDLELAASYMQQYEVAVDRFLGMALRTSGVTAGPRVFGNQSLNAYDFRPTGLPYTTIQGS